MNFVKEDLQLEQEDKMKEMVFLSFIFFYKYSIYLSIYQLFMEK